jgi:Domain of unknown function (DUF4133)
MKTYPCNRGINRPMEFRGLQAQYIWWVAGVVVVSLLLFAVLHLCGVSSWVCLPAVLGMGGSGIARVYHLSRTYGQHGLMKRRAARRVPTAIRSRSRAIFQQSIWGNGKAVG